MIARVLLFTLLAACFAVFARAGERPNLLLITVDDMSCDSLGAFGCPLEGTSPHLDRLAAESMRFERAHVQVGNCFPSRNVMWSGRYPHRSGVEGFYQVKPIDYPVLCDLMQDGGYFAAIRGKVEHSTPYSPYGWDADLTVLEDGTKAHPKDVHSYFLSTKAGIAAARAAGKPFCLNINISDPHLPFWKPGDPNQTSRVFTPEEVPVPGFLPDDPVIREELALYYSTVRRADDCAGEILRALEESGEKENTFILFLSDHGMPLPFAKTQLYHHSTWTPLILRWPGVSRPGSVDREHLLSAVDILPTLCDVAGIAHPAGFDGRSFAPLIKGEKQEGRDRIFKVYNENSGGNRHPIRAIQTPDYLYLFNPWSDGKNVFATATNGTATWRRMKELAASDQTIADRVDALEHRTVEELYQVSRDPDCRHNLIDNPEHAEQAAALRRDLEKIMETTGDHALDPFRKRDDRAVLAAYVEEMQAAADARRTGKGKGKRSAKLIRIQAPESIDSGQPFVVRIPHSLDPALGEQKLQVTLKKENGGRIERKIAPIRGKAVAEVSFDIPPGLAGASISLAAFVGEEFGKHLQHVATGKILVK